MEPRTRVLLALGDGPGNPPRPKKGHEDSPHRIIVAVTMGAPEAQRADAQTEAPKAKCFGGANPERVPFHGHGIFHNLVRHAGNRRLAEKKLKMFEDTVKIARGINSTTNMAAMGKQSPDKSHKPARTVAISWAHAPSMMRRTMLNLYPKPIAIIMLDRHDDPTSRTASRTHDSISAPIYTLYRPHQPTDNAASHTC